MATDYTVEEKTALAEAVMLTGMAVSIVDVGIVSTAIEAAAMAKEIGGASKKYPDNGIIQSLFNPENPSKEVSSSLQVQAEEMRPEVAVDTAIAKINRAITILTAKNTPEEIQEFKEFLYHCGEVVANAAGSGLFGSGNPKVSETEAAALAKIKVALGL